MVSLKVMAMAWLMEKVMGKARAMAKAAAILTAKGTEMVKAKSRGLATDRLRVEQFVGLADYAVNA
jgi:hypothetical protein